MSVLAEQIQYIHPHELDYPLRNFVDFIIKTRPFFNKSLKEIIRDQKVLSSKEVLKSIETARRIINKILNGEYKYDSEGGKIYINNKSYVKINYSSSGQQECLWILLPLFLILLEKTETIVFIEEPEAHLFPSAQKEIMNLITLVRNETRSSFIITTHSPYIVSCVNNFLYAYNLYQNKPDAEEKISQVIKRYNWLPPNETGGCFVSDGEVANLVHEDTPALKNEMLDSASEDINDEFDELLDITAEVYCPEE